MSFGYVIGCKLQKLIWRSFAGENSGVRKNASQFERDRQLTRTPISAGYRRTEDIEEKKGLGPKPRPFNQ